MPRNINVHHVNRKLLNEKIKAKDFDFSKVKKHLKRSKKVEQALGLAPIQHLGRKEEAQDNGIFVPPVFQGSLNACVVCSVIEAMTYLHWKNTGKIIRLDWETVYNNVPHYEGGTKPSEVLEYCRKVGVPELGTTNIHKLDAWSRLMNPTPEKILDAVLLGGVAILGIDTFKAQLLGSSYSHEVCHLDFNVLDNKYQIVNHWDRERQLFNDVPMNMSLINCIVLTDKPDIPKDELRIGRSGIFANYFSKLLKCFIL